LFTGSEGVGSWLSQRKQFHSEEAWTKIMDALKATKTLYVGNLSFFTTEEQIYELFSRCGPVKRVVMGLNKFDKTPCGFCFVEYYSHEAAVTCKKHVSGTKLDDRVIRADLDPGFEEGRQFGRSQKSGGQIRDDHRSDYDSGRGGWGARVGRPEQKSTFIPMRDRPRDRSRSRSRERGGGGSRRGSREPRERRDGKEAERDRDPDEPASKRQKTAHSSDELKDGLGGGDGGAKSEAAGNGTEASSSSASGGGGMDLHADKGRSGAGEDSAAAAGGVKLEQDETAADLADSNPRFREAAESDED